MKTVQEYLDEVCGTISCIPYRRTIRRELKSHMEDSITKKKAQGMDPKEAVRQTISELGDARELGLSYQQNMSMRPNYRLFAFAFLPFLLYMMAALNLKTAVFNMNLALFICFWGICCILPAALRKFDLEKHYIFLKYVYITLMLFAVPVSLLADIKARQFCMELIGIGLIFLIVFFVYRLQVFGGHGGVAALLFFLLPIPLFLVTNTYAALFLYLTIGVSTFAAYAKKEKGFCGKWLILLPVTFTITAGTVLILCRDSIVRRLNNWNNFFLRTNPSPASLAEHYETYPLAAGIGIYGYWTVAVYAALILLILIALLQMKKKMHHFLARHILNSIAFILLIKTVFAILLNLGYPVFTSFALPFAGTTPEQFSNLFLIALAQYTFCFGNAMFSDYSFHAENRFLESIDGKITFYFKNTQEEQ